jgi:hypothetical protein
MAQNAEQEGQGVEQQNLDNKLNVEWDMERIVGTAETAWEKVAAGAETAWERAAAGAETAWEKAAVGKKTETAKTTAQTEKRTVETQKRTVKMWKTAERTQKTAVVNKKIEGEFLYQNHRNTRQTDSRTILYNLKQKKLYQEQEQRFVY